MSNGIAVTPDGKRAFVSNGKDGTIMAIDTARNEVIGTIEVGKRPWNMAITHDGKKLYVANGRSNSVSVVDTVNLKKLADVTVGESPWGVVIP
jgi:YVTN family beta-propeller protein